MSVPRRGAAEGPRDASACGVAAVLRGGAAEVVPIAAHHSSAGAFVNHHPVRPALMWPHPSLPTKKSKSCRERQGRVKSALMQVITHLLL